jgi:hypothetical protein
MTEHERNILQHILEGGKITNSTLDEPILLDYLGSSKDDNWEIPLDELGSYEIYYTEDQLTIQALRKELADMTDKLKEIQTQKKKLGANLREVNGSGPKSTTTSPYRKHLTDDEIKEIEAVFKHDFKTPAKILMNTFGISQPVACKLRLGKHGKSSPEYIKHLRYIGQYKD